MGAKGSVTRFKGQMIRSLQWPTKRHPTNPHQINPHKGIEQNEESSGKRLSFANCSIIQST